ncbi:WD40 repeat domain-containing protein [Siculibacillus lacustris]|uniref:WD40 repeat domain-containing protein n=1 Tax=Siculibacillus lacustris TaxID=1549641 RepID=A0A4Q9VWP7_9HYPH|nr:WD40 repeat domain-containing protein [Siculibacillus lacustris]TBW40759.1 WD40 repeat domain-containing protein [Siculibacillus lacustris]
MATVDSWSLESYVVATAFVGEAALFACGDGTIERREGIRADRSVVHDGGILAAVASADGKALLTGGDDGRVMATGAEGASTLLFEKPGKWLDQLAVGPQGAIACAAGRTAWVRLADGTIVEFPHDKAVGGVAFLPKGLRLATATTDMARLHWITAKGTPVDLPWKGAHTGVVISPDGRFLVTTMQEPALHGWRIDDAKNMRMTGYPAKVKSVSWSAKGRFLATAGANAAILWPFLSKDGPMGKAPLQLSVREQLVSRVACHPSEDVVAIGWDDGMILGVRFGDSAEALLLASQGSPVSALAWDRAGVRLAYGCENGAAGVIDIRA